LAEPVVRFEIIIGQQLQTDWAEVRKSRKGPYVFPATLGYSRVSYVEFVDNMKVDV